MVPPMVIGAKASAGANWCHSIKVKGALQIYTSRESSTGFIAQSDRQTRRHACVPAAQSSAAILSSPLPRLLVPPSLYITLCDLSTQMPLSLIKGPIPCLSHQLCVRGTLPYMDLPAHGALTFRGVCVTR